MNPADDGGDFLSGWRRRALFASIALSAAGYIAVSLWSGWRGVSEALASIGILGTLTALALSLVNYALRFARWQGYLAVLGQRVPAGASLRIYLAGFALTTLPGKFGEAVRSVFLRAHGVPWRHSLAAFFSERLSDLMAMALLAALGLWLYPPTRPFLLPLALLILATLLLLNRVAWLRRLADWLAGRHPGRAATAFGHLVGIAEQSGHCFRLPVMLAGIGLGLIAWAAEGLALYLLAHWLGIELSLAAALFIYAFAVLVGALSFLPGGLGGTELTMVALLLLNGFDEPQAVAATLLIRLATLWFAVLLGLGALLRQQAATGR